MRAEKTDAESNADYDGFTPAFSECLLPAWPSIGGLWCQATRYVASSKRRERRELGKVTKAQRFT